MVNLLVELTRGMIVTNPTAEEPSITSAASTCARQHRPSGVVIGRIAGLTETGQPVVAFPTSVSENEYVAASLVAIEVDQVGSEVAVVFAEGQPDRPLVLGVLRGPAPVTPRTDQPSRSVCVRADGERILLTADREIVLRCGKSSITLTADGNVSIRGAYVLSRASGTNRIRGGNVQIN
jgi:hypothetical protein